MAQLFFKSVFFLINLKSCFKMYFFGTSVQQTTRNKIEMHQWEKKQLSSHFNGRIFIFCLFSKYLLCFCFQREADYNLLFFSCVWCAIFVWLDFLGVYHSKWRVYFLQINVFIDGQRYQGKTHMYVCYHIMVNLLKLWRVTVIPKIHIVWLSMV